jgi:hypothetical protein
MNFAFLSSVLAGAHFCDFRSTGSSYCQKSWMSPEPQAASFSPSLKLVTAITAGNRGSSPPPTILLDDPGFVRFGCGRFGQQTLDAEPLLMLPLLIVSIVLIPAAYRKLRDKLRYICGVAASRRNEFHSLHPPHRPITTVCD